jgi:putative tricarboxylic transport membrane protein
MGHEQAIGLSKTPEGRNMIKNKRVIGEIAVVALIFLGVAGVALQQIATSFAAQNASSGGPLKNAAMFPQLLIAILVVLGCVQIGMSIRTHRLSNGPATGETRPDARSESAVPGEPPDPAEPRAVLHRKAIICLVIFAAYLGGVGILGYPVATFTMLFAMFFVLGTSPLVASIVAFLAMVTVGIVFGMLLNVVLPIGIIGISFPS